MILYITIVTIAQEHQLVHQELIFDQMIDMFDSHSWFYDFQSHTHHQLMILKGRDLRYTHDHSNQHRSIQFFFLHPDTLQCYSITFSLMDLHNMTMRIDTD